MIDIAKINTDRRRLARVRRRRRIVTNALWYIAMAVGWRCLVGGTPVVFLGLAALGIAVALLHPL